MMKLYANLTGLRDLSGFWKVSPRELLAWASIQAGEDALDLDPDDEEWV